jgi:hypothetical protein
VANTQTVTENIQNTRKERVDETAEPHTYHFHHFQPDPTFPPPSQFGSAQSYLLVSTDPMHVLHVFPYFVNPWVAVVTATDHALIATRVLRSVLGL